jgi:hypothetical protein
VSDEIRPGFYRDANGEWQRDRRVNPDRRKAHTPFPHHDRRLAGRRKADREFMEREHREMIEDALEEFAHERDRHV